MMHSRRCAAYMDGKTLASPCRELEISTDEAGIRLNPIHVIKDQG